MNNRKNKKNKSKIITVVMTNEDLNIHLEVLNKSYHQYYKDLLAMMKDQSYFTWKNNTKITSTKSMDLGIKIREIMQESREIITKNNGNLNNKSLLIYIKIMI